MKNFSNEYFSTWRSDLMSNYSVPLNDHPKREELFNKNYPFFTGSSEHMKKHFKNYAKFAKKYIKDSSKIIEIALTTELF